MINYKQKYLKYKLKYLNLKKNKLGGSGGRPIKRRRKDPLAGEFIVTSADFDNYFESDLPDGNEKREDVNEEESKKDELGGEVNEEEPKEDELGGDGEP